jgi:hypothetical protein
VDLVAVLQESIQQSQGKAKADKESPSNLEEGA